MAETGGNKLASESMLVLENVLLRQDKELGKVLLVQLAAGGAGIGTAGSIVVVEGGATTCGVGNGVHSEACRVI